MRVMLASVVRRVAPTIQTILDVVLRMCDLWSAADDVGSTCSERAQVLVSDLLEFVDVHAPSSRTYSHVTHAQYVRVTAMCECGAVAAASRRRERLARLLPQSSAIAHVRGIHDIIAQYEKADARVDAEFAAQLRRILAQPEDSHVNMHVDIDVPIARVTQAAHCLVGPRHLQVTGLLVTAREQLAIRERMSCAPGRLQDLFPERDVAVAVRPSESMSTPKKKMEVEKMGKMSAAERLRYIASATNGSAHPLNVKAHRDRMARDVQAENRFMRRGRLAESAARAKFAALHTARPLEPQSEPPDAAETKHAESKSGAGFTIPYAHVAGTAQGLMDPRLLRGETPGMPSAVNSLDQIQALMPTPTEAKGGLAAARAKLAASSAARPVGSDAIEFVADRPRAAPDDARSSAIGTWREMDGFDDQARARLFAWLGRPLTNLVPCSD